MADLSTEQETEGEPIAASPDRCPITGRKFFMNVDHPELGYVATYGGPFDSYTLPYVDEDGDLRCEHYDHDRGDWIEGGNPLGAWVSTEQPARWELPWFVQR